jgi:hypothetical protein
MALSDTQIHHVELLLTLDYLLNNTDEKHPATQQAICLHAKHFGYHYDPNAKSGNDVRRQRIGGCLSFLYDVSQKNKGKLPFVINKTESNKYYAESKYDLSENQVIETIAAIKNDKFISQEETSYLENKILRAFLSSKESRGSIGADAEARSQGIQKFSCSSSRNLKLVARALFGKLLIRVNYYSLQGEDKNSAMMKHFNWYRVYKIKEYNKIPYAFLIPVNGGGYKFEPIDELDIPDDCLSEEFYPNRDLNALYFKKAEGDCSRMGSTPLDKLFETAKIPLLEGFIRTSSFYFSKKYLYLIRQRYFNFFGSMMVYTSTSLEEIKKFSRLKKIFPKEVVGGDYYYVSTTMNTSSFMGWLMSDTRESGDKTIGELVHVLEPTMVVKHMAYRYKELAEKYSLFLHMPNKS